jgi:hypothetical protein
LQPPLKKLKHTVKKTKKTEKAPHFLYTNCYIKTVLELLRNFNPSFLLIADLDLGLFDNHRAKNVQVNAFLEPASASVFIASFYKSLLGSGKILQPATLKSSIPGIK